MALDQKLKQMKRLKMTIHLESPLLITARQVGFVWESGTFVPGGVLRGAVAEVAARHGQDLKTLFDRPNGPRFGHAYAALGPPVGILPHTARTCKRHSGFRRDEEDNERHGVRDTLLLQAFGEAKVEAHCTTCDQGTVPYGGAPYVSIGSSSSGTRRYVSPRVILRRIGRTAVARERGAVADRLLYTLEVISEQMERDELDDHGLPRRAATQFHGFVWVDGSDDWPWGEWIQKVTHLGGARSRGLGLVRVEVEESPPQESSGRKRFQVEAQLSATEDIPDIPPGEAIRSGKAPPPERLLAFNRAAYAAGAKRDYWYFSLDLLSDAALGDVRGPCYRPQPADLGLPAQVEWIWELAGYGQAGGWSAAWGLPKPVTPTLTAGSTFVYRVPQGDEELTRQVLERCVALEQGGIGRRREEGLGWLQICTPFHLETEVRE